MNNIEKCITMIVEKVMSTKYQNMKNPPIQYAMISNQREEGMCYIYTLKVVDERAVVKSAYPPIPAVRSLAKYEVGTMVTVAMVNGELDPFILGEVA